MKTRNQLTAHKIALAEPLATTTIPINEGATTSHSGKDRAQTSAASPNHSSPSPPRLRINRSSAAQDLRSAQQQQSSVNQGGQAISSATRSPSLPPATLKRTTPTVPTRILPKRSCGRPTSLLAGSQPNLSGANNNSNSSPNKATNLSKKAPDQSKKDTHSYRQAPHQLIPTPLQSGSKPTEQRSDSSLLISDNSNRTANSIIRNYSKDTTSTRSVVPYKQSAKQQHDSDQQTTIINNKTKLVRISLPDNAVASPTASGSNDDLGDHGDAHDNDRYMFTINGLKKIRTARTELAEATARRDANIKYNNDSINEFQVDSTNDAIPMNLVYSKKNFNLLIAVTGSVATIKLVELTRYIKSMFPRPLILPKSNGPTIEATIKIKIVMTNGSKHFIQKEELIKSLNDSSIEIYDDADEWSLWKKMGDSVLHIELRKWADMCLIAPLDCNTMAKMANGICDNLLTCVVRAWDVLKPLVYCPAMNVHMYNHPITEEHLSKLRSYGYLQISPVEKRLACGDVGIGGMAPVETISRRVLDCLMFPKSREVSLTRRLLNQQPTYPIIPTSDSQANARLPSSISNQILSRFRANNQISVHAIPNSTLRANQQLLESSYGDEFLASKKQKKTIPSISNDYSARNEARPYAVQCLPGIGNNINNNYDNGKQKMGGVTSVQNLRAIGMSNGSLVCEPARNVSGDGCRLDIEPSKLLEQSMTTDESASIDLEPNNSTPTSFGSLIPGLDQDSSPSADGSFSRINSGLTPVFNTSKFLALCHNKERGCFTCTICKHDYKNRKSMARHLKEQHVQGNIYQCRPCGVSYKRREKLIKHNRERHPGFLSIEH